ncbi:hypothetical protein M9H77_05881 [Catharanthus roseus]|uniref:Uncharacterized protein n=1 Tax=Catharanthus roseus TaxID=4058 RepID=A0ACC0BQJ9_CATRO|nr:hypothetical protein M9H77_05881 [Catharanthus roseus]
MIHYFRIAEDAAYNIEGSTDFHIVESIDSDTARSTNTMSSSSAFTIVGLRSRRMSTTCGRRVSIKMHIGPNIIHDQNKASIGGQMKDLIGDAQATKKRPIWILEILWEIPEYKAFCVRNKMNRNEGQGVKKQRSAQVLKRVETDPMKLRPKVLLCSITSDGLNCRRLYRDCLEAAHLITENNQAAASLPPCCLEAEQKISLRMSSKKFNLSIIGRSKLNQND